MKKNRIIIKNIAIIFLILLGIKNLIAALPLRAIEAFSEFYQRVLDPKALALHHTLSFILGFLMILLAYRLYKRSKMAWIIEVTALSLTIVLQIARYHRLTVPIVIIEIFILSILFFYRKDFPRKSNPISLKTSITVFLASIGTVITISTAGLYILRNHIKVINKVYDAFIASIKVLVLTDTSIIETTSKGFHLYIYSLISIYWVSVFASLLLVLKPIIYKQIITKYDREKARNLTLLYGENPISYLAMEYDKQYYFSSKIKGFCAFTIIQDVLVISGDVLCSKNDAEVFIEEIKEYCKKNFYHLLMVNTTDRFKSDYEKYGFASIKYGEDAVFLLSEYNLKGGKAAKVRAAINHATKANITVKEYLPLNKRDKKIENQFNDISYHWLKTKGGYEMQFSVGGIGLDDPLDRRYFYAQEPNGTILGFVVFLPYKNGYLADITRKRENTTGGVLEKTIYEAFMIFKEEGIVWGNMGLSPLYNVADTDKKTMTQRLFNYIYENLNGIYGFKSLHHSKEKFAPTHFIPRYLVFYPKTFSPKLAYALIRCQLKGNLLNMFFKNIFKIKDKDNKN